MAHFAELDNNNTVLQVIVINNDITHDSDGVEQEELGIAFCKSLFGQDTNWVQTSCNNKIRGIYAGIGMSYDKNADIFVPDSIGGFQAEAQEEIQSAIEGN